MLSGMATGTLTGCASKLDTGRVSVDTGSFGHTVMTLICKRMVYLEDLEDGDGRVDVRGDAFRELCRSQDMTPAGAFAELRAFQAVRPTVTGALDAMLPAAFLDDVQRYVTGERFLAMYDDRTAVAAVEALAGVLELLAGDDDALQALVRLGHQEGYVPASASRGALELILDYPALPDFLLHTTRELAPGGDAHPALTDLTRALAASLRAIEPADEPRDPDSIALLALDLLLGERAMLDTGQEIPVVLRDARGLAHVAPLATGALPPPFVDTDGDTLADIDDMGRFVDAGGAPIDAPAPFARPGDEDPAWIERDGQGRAMFADTGAFVYRYIDLDDTVLAALARDAAAILDPARGTAVDALMGLSALMGPRQPQTRIHASGERVEYLGFDLDQSALLDMAYGYLLLLGDIDIHDTLALVRTLLQDNEAELARLIEGLVRTARVADEFPDVSLEPGSPLFDDLVPVIREILATPGLFEDLMRAMEDPHVAMVGEHLHDYMTYKDRFYYHPVTQELIGEFETEVDRSAPGTGDNRSIWQRVLHLLDDTRGVTLCNQPISQIDLGAIVVNKAYGACELFEIEDLAVYYVRSLAYDRDTDGDFYHDDDGDLVRAAELELHWNDPLIEAAVTDEVMELATGIEGFGAHPTPQALNRTLFLEPRPALIAQLIEPVRTRHGELYIERHAGTLPAWEKNDFYEHIQPLVQPFVDHGAEELFIDLLVTLHTHWPARDSGDHQQQDPDAPGYAWASNIAAYEPILAEIFDRGDLLDAVVATAPTLNTVRIASGRTLPDILRGAAAYLFNPQVGLVNRQGEHTSTTSDGRPVDVLSPWQILADAYEQKDELLAAYPERARAWDEAFSEIIDVLGRGEYDDTTGWRFRNPRLRGVGLALIDFVEARLRAHDATADRMVWLIRDLPADLEELLGGPVAAGLMDLSSSMALTMAGAPQARAALEGLLAYLLDETANPTGFRSMITTLADVMQLALLDDRDRVPLLRVLGEIVDPQHGWIDALLRFGLGARLAEGEITSADESTFLQLLRNGLAEHRPGKTPLGDILDGVAEVHRARPFEDLGERLTSADHRAMFQSVARFLEDEKRGLRKFVAIIESRALD
jgi:hypothetical protein